MFLECSRRFYLRMHENIVYFRARSDLLGVARNRSGDRSDSCSVACIWPLRFRELCNISFSAEKRYLFRLSGMLVEVSNCAYMNMSLARIRTRSLVFGRAPKHAEHAPTSALLCARRRQINSGRAGLSIEEPTN
ncbi:uncharacterized protein LOC112590607 [Harpegnathos saltator]|uniref:uncharacterized protein LOC112590607 n=1 Tax=Harpegnathos saltator TaxID=610380 RepID=UPI000DBEDAB5|nr:uncharacterized protein LOC112590607 [Harpegnathos saltator]